MAVGNNASTASSKQLKKPAEQPRPFRLKEKTKDVLWAYFFIAPVFLGLLVFYIIPFIQNIYFSLCNVNRFNQAKFAGLVNYVKLFSSDELLRAVRNTFVYVILTVPAGIFLAILIAVLLNQKLRGQSVYRTLYYLPAITMPAAIAMVWKWMYNGDYGIINQVLARFGIAGQNWLNEPSTAMGSIAVVGIWMMVGYNMVILLAGLQGIPSYYYEAAALDGADARQQFFHITIPILSPSIFFVLITALISGFQVFDIIYMMIARSSMASEAVESLIVIFYRNAFTFGDKGYASAISIFTFLIILLFTVFQLWLQKHWVIYD